MDSNPDPGAPTSAAKEGDDDDDQGRCDRCGGDGFIEYNDGDGSDWGEDCPSEINHLIVCRQCKGTGVTP